MGGGLCLECPESGVGGGGGVLLACYLAALDRGGYCTGEGWGGGGVGGGEAGRGKLFGGVNPWCSSEEGLPTKKAHSPLHNTDF
jgi:hypothetical protein